MDVRQHSLEQSLAYGCNPTVRRTTTSSFSKGPKIARRGRGQYSKKSKQVVETLQWVEENYEPSEGVCVPRCTLYQHYLDFCRRMQFPPVGAAAFGKLIRQKFPSITTRRLGTRGQSRYHYYGIGVKNSSIYYNEVYSGKGVTRFSGQKVKRTESFDRKRHQPCKLGFAMPVFPDISEFYLPHDVNKNKLETFFVMYKAHSQRILTAVLSASFEEVQQYLVHFWQSIPGHMLDLLKSSFFCELVSVWDCLMYKSVEEILIPSSIQEIPESSFAAFSERSTSLCRACLGGLTNR